MGLTIVFIYQFCTLTSRKKVSTLYKWQIYTFSNGKCSKNGTLKSKQTTTLTKPYTQTEKSQKMKQKVQSIDSQKIKKPLKFCPMLKAKVLSSIYLLRNFIRFNITYTHLKFGQTFFTCTTSCQRLIGFNDFNYLVIKCSLKLFFLANYVINTLLYEYHAKLKGS